MKSHLTLAREGRRKLLKALEKEDSDAAKKLASLAEPEKEDLLRNRPRGLKRALRLRKGIERVFGDAKVWHRLERARYRGKERVAVQALLTFLVINVKKMVNRITSSWVGGFLSPTRQAPFHDTIRIVLFIRPGGGNSDEPALRQAGQDTCS